MLFICTCMCIRNEVKYGFSFLFESGSSFEFSFLTLFSAFSIEFDDSGVWNSSFTMSNMLLSFVLNVVVSIPKCDCMVTISNPSASMQFPVSMVTASRMTDCVFALNLVSSLFFALLPFSFSLFKEKVELWEEWTKITFSFFFLCKGGRVS